MVFYVFCFVFKQKTAYEMRISDWSSDVCSSDLDADGRLTLPRSSAILISSVHLSPDFESTGGSAPERGPPSIIWFGSIRTSPPPVLGSLPRSQRVVPAA